MTLAILLKEYIFWHYGGALKDLTALSKNFLWFGCHFFSLKLLLKTLFSPFYRIQEEYRRGLSFEVLAENLVANVVSRTVGLVLRIFVLAAGIVFETAVGITVILAFILWLLLPSVVAALLLSGFALLI